MNTLVQFLVENYVKISAYKYANNIENTQPCVLALLHLSKRAKVVIEPNENMKTFKIQILCSHFTQPKKRNDVRSIISIRAYIIWHSKIIHRFQVQTYSDNKKKMLSNSDDKMDKRERKKNHEVKKRIRMDSLIFSRTKRAFTLFSQITYMETEFKNGIVSTDTKWYRSLCQCFIVKC